MNGRRYCCFVNTCTASIYFLKVNLWNMFKVKTKHTRTMSLALPLTLLWCFFCELWTYFTPFPSVSSVDLNQVNVSWVSTPDAVLLFNADYFLYSSFWYINAFKSTLLKNKIASDKILLNNDIKIVFACCNLCNTVKTVSLVMRFLINFYATSLADLRE